MDAATFFANFETIAEAPGGVAKLRELILELAVGGKLVPQDPSDEPASVLLKRIAAEKARLVEKGARRREEQFPPVSTGERLFNIPSGWEWVRMGTIADQRLGKMLDAAKNKGTPLPYLRNLNVQWFRFELSDVQEMKFEDEERQEFELRSGDVLVCEGGEPGRAAVWEEDSRPMMFQKALHRIRSFSFINPHYLVYLLRCDSLNGNLEKHFTGATIKHFTGKALSNYCIPLPPRVEQDRIVARIKQLFEHCAQLEAKAGERRTVRVALQSSSLNALTSADTPEALATAWARLRDHWDVYTSDDDSIEQLRQAIFDLTLADGLEPGKRATSTLAGDYMSLQNGYAFKSEWFSSQGLRLLRNVNIGHAVINWEDTKQLPEDKAAEFERFYLNEGDIVISLDRPIISTGIKLARIQPADMPCLLLQRVGRVQFKDDGVLADYFFAWLHSSHFKQAINPGRSNGVPHISSKDVERVPFCPPDIEEQKARLDRLKMLLNLCDQLKLKLQSRSEVASRLLSATVNWWVTAD